MKRISYCLKIKGHFVSSFLHKLEEEQAEIKDLFSQLATIRRSL